MAHLAQIVTDVRGGADRTSEIVGRSDQQQLAAERIAVAVREIIQVGEASRDDAQRVTGRLHAMITAAERVRSEGDAIFAMHRRSTA